MGRFLDLTGSRFGLLLVVSLSDRAVVKGNRFWVCRCDCGGDKVVSGFHLKSRHTASCGCLHAVRTAEAKTVHGHASKLRTGRHSPTYEVWASMLKRCNNPKATNYARYGGRGIQVCERWHDFRLFLEDMGIRPDGCEIDRKDNDGNYEPGNCQWITSSANSRNRRSNRVIETPQGPMLLVEAAELSGIPMSTLSNRVARGWPSDQLFAVSRQS